MQKLLPLIFFVSTSLAAKDLDIDFEINNIYQMRYAAQVRIDFTIKPNKNVSILCFDMYLIDKNSKLLDSKEIEFINVKANKSEKAKLYFGGFLINDISSIEYSYSDCSGDFI